MRRGGHQPRRGTDGGSFRGTSTRRTCAAAFEVGFEVAYAEEFVEDRAGGAVGEGRRDGAVIADVVGFAVGAGAVSAEVRWAFGREVVVLSLLLLSLFLLGVSCGCCRDVVEEQKGEEECRLEEGT